MTYYVIMVEPKNEGNIGAVARTMKNFGLQNLILVNPPHIGDEASQRAMHGLDVLEKAKVVKSFEEALKGMDYIVGTSGVSSLNEKNFLRQTITPKEFAVLSQKLKGSVALVFGREDFGLFREELMKCDAVITIPSDRKYPILNISHAASIIFYELFSVGIAKKERKEASVIEKEKLYEFFDKLLEVIDYPEFKKEKTKIMFRRLMGRAIPSKWEFYTFMGVLSKAISKISKK